MNFLTIFLDDSRSSGGSSISGEDDSISEFAADNGGTCFFVGHRLNEVLILNHLVSDYEEIYLCVLVKSKPPIC